MINQPKEKFAFGDHFVVDDAFAGGLSETLLGCEHVAVNEEGVSREDRFAEFQFVRAHEVTDFSGVFRLPHHDDAGHLGHGFDLKDAWHDGMAGEMALKIRLVDGDGFDPDGADIDDKFDNSIHHEEWITVREGPHDLIDVEHTALGREGRRRHGLELGLAFDEDGGEFGIGSMAGFDRDDVAAESAPGEGKVADEIENFVTNKFVRETQGFLAENTFSAGDDGIFQAAAFDEPFLHQRLDVFVKNKGPGPGDFLFVKFRGDLRAQVLGEPPFGTHLGARDAELGIGQDSED